MKLLAGRNLQPHDTSGAYIINQTYSKLLGFSNPQLAVGRLVSVDGRQAPIIGVVGDYFQKSLHYAIKPGAICYSNGTRYTRTIHLTLKPHVAGSDNWTTALKQMQKDWQQVFPDDEFRYRFVDESIAKFYEAEQHTVKLLNWATGLSVLISCLGLLGLAIYTTTQRTKEIGIRKVMGASIGQIVTLLSTDFMKLILIAFVVALPLAWLAMSQWLQNFAYHTNIGIGIFATAIGAMLVTALLTMSFQTIKAAIANPVKSLRSE